MGRGAQAFTATIEWLTMKLVRGLQHEFGLWTSLETGLTGGGAGWAGGCAMQSRGYLAYRASPELSPT